MKGLLLALLWLSPAAVLAAPAQPRIESKSADLRLVGILQADRLAIHISRLEDNVPLKDAAVAMTLRGTRYAALAEADGGYSVRAPDLTLPGSAAVEFEVTAGTLHEVLKGTLELGSGSAGGADSGTARGTYWWVLNFGVCIAFLWLFSRRKKSAD